MKPESRRGGEDIDVSVTRSGRSRVTRCSVYILYGRLYGFRRKATDVRRGERFYFSGHNYGVAPLTPVTE